MNRLHLAVGQPTGHHDNHRITLMSDDHTILSGQGSLRAARALSHVIRRGCQATGRTFTVHLPGGEDEDS